MGNAFMWSMWPAEWTTVSSFSLMRAEGGTGRVGVGAGAGARTVCDEDGGDATSLAAFRESHARIQHDPRLFEPEAARGRTSSRKAPLAPTARRSEEAQRQIDGCARPRPSPFRTRTHALLWSKQPRAVRTLCAPSRVSDPAASTPCQARASCAGRTRAAAASCSWLIERVSVAAAGGCQFEVAALVPVPVAVVPAVPVVDQWCVWPTLNSKCRSHV